VIKHNFDQTPKLLETFDQLIRSSEIRSSDHFPFILFFAELNAYQTLLVLAPIATKLFNKISFFIEYSKLLKHLKTVFYPQINWFLSLHLPKDILTLISNAVSSQNL
jgi:hypothetical protein